jgi:hypothetical protein
LPDFYPPFLSFLKKKKKKLKIVFGCGTISLFVYCQFGNKNFIKMVRFIIFVYEFKRVEKPFTVKTSETLNE